MGNGWLVSGQSSCPANAPDMIIRPLFVEEGLGDKASISPSFLSFFGGGVHNVKALAKLKLMTTFVDGSFSFHMVTSISARLLAM